MTRLLLVGLAAAGLSTVGFAQTPIPGGTTQPTPPVTGAVTGSATTQTNPTGTTGTVTGTGTTTVPGVGGATTTTTGTGMVQVPNQMAVPGSSTTTYPYGVNPYQPGAMPTGGMVQGVVTGNCGMSATVMSPSYPTTSYTDYGTTTTRKRGLFRR